MPAKALGWLAAAIDSDPAAGPGNKVRASAARFLQEDLCADLPGDGPLLDRLAAKAPEAAAQLSAAITRTKAGVTPSAAQAALAFLASPRLGPGSPGAVAGAAAGPAAVEVRLPPLRCLRLLSAKPMVPAATPVDQLVPPVAPLEPEPPLPMSRPASDAALVAAAAVAVVAPSPGLSQQLEEGQVEEAVPAPPAFPPPPAATSTRDAEGEVGPSGRDTAPGGLPRVLDIQLASCSLWVAGLKYGMNESTLEREVNELLGRRCVGAAAASIGVLHVPSLLPLCSRSNSVRVKVSYPTRGRKDEALVTFPSAREAAEFLHKAGESLEEPWRDAEVRAAHNMTRWREWPRSSRPVLPAAPPQLRYCCRDPSLVRSPRDSNGDGLVWVGGVRGVESEEWVKAALQRRQDPALMPNHVYRVNPDHGRCPGLVLIYPADAVADRTITALIAEWVRDAPPSWHPAASLVILEATEPYSELEREIQREGGQLPLKMDLPRRSGGRLLADMPTVEVCVRHAGPVPTGCPEPAHLFIACAERRGGTGQAVWGQEERRVPKGRLRQGQAAAAAGRRRQHPSPGARSCRPACGRCDPSIPTPPPLGACPGYPARVGNPAAVSPHDPGRQRRWPSSAIGISPRHPARSTRPQPLILPTRHCPSGTLLVRDTAVRRPGHLRALLPGTPH